MLTKWLEILRHIELCRNVHELMHRPQLVFSILRSFTEIYQSVM